MEHATEHKLRRVRKAAGLSLDDLARQTGSGKATLSRIENWRMDASGPLIRRLCALFPELEPNDFYVAPVDRPERQRESLQ